MRYVLLILACLFATHAVADTKTAKDSLQHLLNKTTSAGQKIKILQGLADLNYEQPTGIDYLNSMYAEAKKANDSGNTIEAMGSLAQAYMKKKDLDSCFYFINELRSYDKDEHAQEWVAYMCMRLFYYYTYQPDQEFDINKRLKEIDEHSKHYSNDIYQRIKYSFILGAGLLEQKKIKEACAHLKTANELCQELPLAHGFKIQVLVARVYGTALAYDLQSPKTIELVEYLLELENQYYELCCKLQRPFFPIASFTSQEYTTLMVNVSFLPIEKQRKYMQQIIELCNKSDADSDKYNLFLSLNNYYLYLKDYNKALETNDSLIGIAYRIAPYNLAGLYQLSSDLYAVMNLYPNAYKTLKRSYAIKDSLNADKMKEELNQLQVQYGVDKLNYEKSELENKNKLIILVGFGVVLIILTSICFYLYKNLKKEKAMKERLRLLKVKAEESEKMKISFINSMCHEIRTPLNSIVGFSDMILNEDIDLEIRQTFPEEIQRNTFMLTSLVNSMLEVSNLDVSDEPLPCASVEMGQLCSNKMDNLMVVKKEGIRCHLDIPKEPVVVSTNELYLGLAIENLLENAHKFTEKGDITLHYHIEGSRLKISVTDTGCGIPLDKHEEVFERFTKLDEYKQGNGLGLYLCRLIVKRLSGEIIIDPSYTNGTRFLISLPA